MDIEGKRALLKTMGVKVFVNIIPGQADIQNVLVGHLIIEEAIREIIAITFKCKASLEEAKLNFSQCIHILRGLHPNGLPEWMWTALKKLNTIRNRLAHNLNPQDIDELIENLFDYVSRMRNTSKKEAIEGGAHNGLTWTINEIAVQIDILLQQVDPCNALNRKL